MWGWFWGGCFLFYFVFFFTVAPTQCCLELCASIPTFMPGLPHDKKRGFLLHVINFYISEVRWGKEIGQ